MDQYLMSKKSKTNSEKGEEVISAKFFNANTILDLKKEHNNSSPYPHLVLKELCNDSFMRKVHNEVIHNLNADLKETDLYKVYQTEELGNIKGESDVNQKKLKHLLKLREALYSKEFRKVVQEATGCEELNEEIDCSCNAYTKNCHLLCHDDVIGSRCVAYIIYFTDPDDLWKPTEGGGLELYPLQDSSKAQGIPEPIPSLTIQPIFNNMALFVVQPGRSYHSVQEVFSDRPRLSISGWYHCNKKAVTDESAGFFRPVKPFASVNMLASANPPGDTGKAVGLKRSRRSSTISPTELLKPGSGTLQFLSSIINPAYLTVTAVKGVNKEFLKESQIQLKDFIIESVASKLKQLCTEEDHRDSCDSRQCPVSYSVGTVSSKKAGWHIVGPAHTQRYCRYDTAHTANPSGLTDDVINNAKSVGELLSIIRAYTSSSDVFNTFLSALTNVSVSGEFSEIRRFRPGLDYTLAHTGIMTQASVLESTLCFAQDEDVDEEVPTWESGEAGGSHCYIEAEDDDEAFDVYRKVDRKKLKLTQIEEDEEDDGESSLLLCNSADFNVLSLVLKDEGVMSFVKYVNSSAPGSRWDICTEYELSD